MPQLGRIVMPYTGSVGVYYGFTIFFAVSAALVPQRRMIYAVIALLGLFTLFGCIEIFGHLMSPNPVRINSICFAAEFLRLSILSHFL